MTQWPSLCATPVCGCRGGGRSSLLLSRERKSTTSNSWGAATGSVFARILPGAARRQDVDSLRAERWEYRESDGKNQ